MIGCMRILPDVRPAIYRQQYISRGTAELYWATLTFDGDDTERVTIVWGRQLNRPRDNALLVST